MTARSATEKLLDDFRVRRPIRATSLIMTIYGDSIEPCGGSVWLGSLIRLLEPLGVNQRLVRTSIFRLAKDNWLTSSRLGRKSYYRLSESGLRRSVDAEARIYSQPGQHWDGNWQIVILMATRLPNKQRDAIRRELRWQGFGQISPDVFAHPVAPMHRVQNMLAEKSLENCAVLMQARTYEHGPYSAQAISDLVRTCCDLNRIELRYNEFIRQFGPLAEAIVERNEPVQPEESFLLRTVLIDSYRRILLQDPQLPDELLPKAWSGDAARNLVRSIYHRLRAGADQHLHSVCETESGLLGEPGASYHERFGGDSECHLSLVEVDRHLV